MVFSANVNDKQKDSIIEYPASSGLSARRVNIVNPSSDPIPVSPSPVALTGSGVITEVVLNSSTWTALPSSPLVGRHAISVQNRSGQEVKVGYLGSGGYVGMVIPHTGERQYDIDDTIVLYGMSLSGSATVNVEEII